MYRINLFRSDFFESKNSKNHIFKSYIPLNPIILSGLLIMVIVLFSACNKEKEDEIDLAKQIPLITTIEVSHVTPISATSGGIITSDGGSTVTVRGICWSTNETPTLSDSITKNGAGAGNFASILTNLKPETTYYLRAYATNKNGTGYGMTMSFTTLNIILPDISTTGITEITAFSAKGGGNVLNDGFSNVTARGVCWSTNSNPTIADNQTNDGTGTGSFTSQLTGLSPVTVYYVRAYATNSAGTSYGSHFQFTTVNPLPIVLTSSISNISNTSAIGGGNVTAQGISPIIQRGVCWSTSQNPTIADNITNNGNGTGSFSSQITDLNFGTTYYVRAYATNATGTAYGAQINFTTLNFGDVYNPTTGKTWMDRNLGASRVAQSSTDAEAYGDLYQWGRGTDGHEKRSSGTTTTLSSSDTPGHGNFITVGSSPYDWRSPQNPNLWQGVNGINNPCPSGYRLPTEAELNAERQSWSSNNAAGAFNSPLKLPVAGLRTHSSGSLGSVGFSGSYWSATVDGTGAPRLNFYSRDAGFGTGSRAFGFSVRCLKD